MKRFFKIVAAALMTSAFTSAAFAGWGPNGQFGNAIPGSKPVGQSSKPSTNPASAPIVNPPDPTKNLGAVPGSYKDPAMQATHSKAWQAAQYAKAKAAFDKKNNSPKLAPTEPFRPLTPVSSSSAQSKSTSGYGGNNSNNGYGNGSMKPQYPNGIPFMPTSNYQTSGYGGNNNGGFFGNDVTNRPRPTNNYPQYPTNNMGNNYPTNNNYPQQTNNYPQYPSNNNYPSKQSQFPMGGYGQNSNSGWGGYGQTSTGGYGGQSSNNGWGGYGGNVQTSGYGSQTSTGSWGPSTSGYGGQASTSSSNWGGYGGTSSTSGYGGQSQYGMFAR